MSFIKNFFMIKFPCDKNIYVRGFCMIKWIISDMDGTLLVDHNKLPDDFDEVMALLKEKNIIFSPASGRQYQSLLGHFAKYKDDMIFIAENGAFVCQNEKELFSSVLPQKAVGFIVKEAENFKHIPIALSGKKYAYIINTDPEFLYQLELYYTHYKVVKSFDEVDDEIVKISICDCHMQNARENVYEKLLPLCKDMQVILSSQIWVDIIPFNTNKGLAIEKVQERLGIRPEECVAFGDYLNDYEMMQSVYYSYAMGNAVEDLKKVARFEAPPNYENGVMNTIRKLLAENK